MITSSVNWIPYSFRTFIRRIPLVSGLQRWLVSRFLSGRPFLHIVNGGPASGLRFEISLPLDKAVWSGTYETAFSAAIREHVKAGHVCYDIGGYRGYMAGVMALAGASKVFAFEPLPANQIALRRLRELNPELNITVKDMAVGNEDGCALLRVMPDPSMGKLEGSSFQPEALVTDEIKVVLQRIDSMVSRGEIPPPSLIKIDVEGAELDVLLGGGDTIRTARPIIFLEAHGSLLEEICRQELNSLGYRVRRIEGEVAEDAATRHLVCLP